MDGWKMDWNMMDRKIATEQGWSSPRSSNRRSKVMSHPDLFLSGPPLEEARYPLGFILLIYGQALLPLLSLLSVSLLTHPSPFTSCPSSFSSNFVVSSSSWSLGFSCNSWVWIKFCVSLQAVVNPSVWLLWVLQHMEQSRVISPSFSKGKKYSRSSQSILRSAQLVVLSLCTKETSGVLH